MIGSDWVFTKPRQWLNRMSDQSQIHYKIIIPHAINSSLPPTSRLKQLTNNLSVRPRPTRIPDVAVNSSPSNQTSTYPELSSLILLLPQSEGKTVILIMEPPERLPLLRTNLWSWGDRNCWRHFISFEVMSAPRCSPVPSTHAFHHFRFLSNGTCHESSVHCRLI